MTRHRRARRTLARVMTFLLAVALLAGAGFVGTAAADAPSCGSVTYTTNSSGFYEVDSVDKLQCIGEDHGSATDQADALSSDYVLTSDIDASGTSTWNGGNGFDPIGTSGSPFTGTFDGNGHSVSGLTVDRGGTNQMGVFGYLDSGGLLTGATFTSVDITGSDQTGGLLGRNAGGDVIEARVTGSVSGDRYTGGVVGLSGGVVRRAGSTASVSGSGNQAGGLVGENRNLVEQSYATSDVSGSFDVGGLVGKNDNGANVKTSFATGSVSGSSTLGGLVGNNAGSVSNSYWDSDVNGNGQDGASTGSFDATGLTTTEMQGQAATQNLDSFGFVGTWHATSGYPALAWEDTSPFYGVAVDSTTSPVDAGETLDVTANVTNWGADGGSQTVTLTDTDFSNSQQDSDSNVALDSGDSTDLTLSWATSSATGTGDVTVDSDDASATASVTVDAYAGGDGSSGTPYEIANWYHLDNVRDNPSAEFVLTADLDSSTAGYSSVASSTANSNNGFDPIGDSGTKFTGTFDGDDHTISGLTIGRGSTDYVGLFGWVGSGGRIENVGVENVDITGNDAVGGLVGYTDAPVTGSYATGDVDGRYRVGGLVGSYFGSVDESYAAVTVSGTSQVGGLVGKNSGPLSESYATGAVAGDSDVGGLVGVNNHFGGGVTSSYATGDVDGTENVGGLVGRNNVGDVTKSYATGDVTGSTAVGGLVGENRATVTDSYWDKGTTNQANAVGTTSGTNSNLQGLTTTQMQRFAPQSNMGALDFQTVWIVTSAYPRLTWEGATALTVDSVNAADTTVDEDASGSVTVTANEGGTNAGEGVTVKVTNDDGLDGFATGDTAVTDTNGQVTFTFDEPTDGTYSPEFAWTEDTSVSDTATVTVRDAPEVSSVVRASPSSPTNANSVDYDVTFTESVSGVEISDFTVTQVSGDVSGSIDSVSSSSGTTITVTVDSITGDGDLRLDLTDDDSITNGNGVALGGTGTSGTADGSYTSGESFTIDNTAPSLDSASKASDTSIDVDISDGGAGIDKSTIAASDFSLSVGSIASIDKTAVTDGGTGTQTVTLNLDSAVDSDTVDVSVVGSIDDTVGNSLSSGTKTASNMDGIAPTLDSASKASDTSIDVDISDGGAGIDKSTIAASDFSLDTGTISSIDTSGVTDGGTGTQTVTINLGSAVDSDTVTVSLQSDGIDDMNGNTRTSESASASNMDGVAPTLDSASKVDTTTIDVDISDGGTGIDKSTIGSGDFSLDTGTVSSIDKTTVTDGGTGTQTVTINLGSAVDSDTVDVSIVGNIDDTSGNSLSSGTKTVSNMDGVAPTLDAASKVDTTTIDVDISEAGSGIDKASIGSGDFSLDSGSISSIDKSGVIDGATGTQTITINLGSTVDADTVTVSLQSDGIDDKNGNTQTSGSASASGMDGVGPTFDSASKVDDTTLTVTIGDGVDVDESTVTRSDFSLSDGSISSITVSESGTDASVSITLDSAVDSDTVDVSVVGSIDDTSGNSLSSGIKTVSNMDGVAPSVSGVTLVDETDGNGAVTAGDTIQITATVTDGVSVASVEADASAFDAGTVTLNDDGPDSGTADDDYSATVTVGSSPAEGDQSITVSATDGAGNGGSQAVASGTLSVDTTDPTFSDGSSTTGSTDEGTTGDVLDVQADDDTATEYDTDVTYSLASAAGSDAAAFSIDSATGRLTLDSARDFENPTDADGNNDYELTVTATDDAGNTGTQAITVSITDVNDAPTMSSDQRSLDPIPEDDVDNDGSTAATILSSAGTTGDQDGDTLGIAVTEQFNIDGIWEYSLDGGATWQSFSTAAVQSDSALLLAPDDRVRVVPDNGFSGTADGSMDFHAWDWTSGAAGDTDADPTTAGGTTAFSTTNVRAKQVVQPAPDVYSIDRLGPTNLTSDETLRFDVTFETDAVGVDSTDFTLFTTNTATTVNGDDDISVSGSGDDYTVSVANVRGNGTLALYVIDDDSITNPDNGVPMGGPGTTGVGNGSRTYGELYTVDRVAPVVSGVTVTDDTDGSGVVAAGDTVQVTATATDPNGVTSVTADASAFDAGTVTLSDEGPNSVSGDDQYSATLTVGPSPTEGAQSVTVSATDGAGNGGSQAISSGTLTVDTTAPSVGNVSIADDTDGNGVFTNGDSVEITATVTDTNAISSVTVDASAFDAGTVTLSDDGPNSASADDQYSATVTVGSAPTEGDQSVRVSATDEATNGGSQAVSSGTLTVDTTAPTADASDSETAGDEDTAIAFDATASTDDDGIASYAWDFGDGTTVTGVSPTHTYSNPGTYTATLTVTDTNGNTGTDTLTVTVEDTTAPTAVTGSDITTRPGEEIRLASAESSDNTGTVGTRWQLGDGSTAAGTLVRYSYDTTGTYTVTLTVEDAAGNSDADTLTVTVESDDTGSPTADAGRDATVDAGDSVSFDASGSSDDTGITSYQWTFGDGATATGVSPTHTYGSAGTYTVSLTVEDGGGNTDIATTTVTVEDTEAPRLGALDLTNANATTIDIGVTSSERLANVTADVSGSASATLVSDDFAEAQSGGNYTYAGSYDSPSNGTYTVTVTGTDSAGNTGTRSGSVEVTETAAGDDSALEPPTLTNTNGTTFEVSVESDEPLRNLSVSLDGPEQTTLSNFTETEVDGRYTYTTTHTAASEGVYSATVERATDADGDEVSGGDSASQPSGTEGVRATLSVTPANVTVTSGTPTTLTVSAADASRGIGAVDVTLSLSGDGQITNVTTADGLTAAPTDDGTRLSETVETANTSATLATVTVVRGAAGNGTLTATGSVADADGTAYQQVTDASATVTVDTLQVGSYPPARNADDDPLFEDVYGDGSVDIFDAIAYYNNRNSPTVEQNPDHFDFDGDGEVGTLFDAIALYETGSP